MKQAVDDATGENCKVKSHLEGRAVRGFEDNKYHCHLSNKWVACWKNEKDSIIIEVYYAGSRENAPY
jgi:hypothetical protein